MPDQSPYSWPQGIRDVVQALVTLGTIYIAYLGNANHSEIQRKGSEIVQKQEDQEAKVDRVKADLERNKAADRKAIEVNLRSAWKYLEAIASDSGKPVDKENAATAKRVLDEFLAHKEQ